MKSITSEVGGSTVVTLVFVALTGWFLVGGVELDKGVASLVDVQPSDISPSPMRDPMHDPPMAEVAGFNRSCNDCHGLFKSSDLEPGTLHQHRSLVMNHGRNTLCLNCHDADNREVLALRGGQTVGFGESQILCAKCHGTTYNDWRKGSHEGL